jgi:hypothetical protein
MVGSSSSSASQRVENQGAIILQGDFDDKAALAAVCNGVGGVFLNVTTNCADFSVEIRHSHNIVRVAETVRARCIFTQT